MKRALLVAGLVALLIEPAGADEPKKSQTYQVPYRLTNTLHTLVRAKVNGKGPFNFIIDTGAPLLFIATPVGKKIGLSPDAKDWATLDRFEVESGVVLNKVKCRVETPFQLEGMNGLGMAGAELHGIIGYTVLAHFRIEFDFTRDTLAWTKLNFDPPTPVGIKAKDGNGAGGLEFIGSMMKFLGALAGKKADSEIVPRGFLGMDVEDADKSLTVRSVLSGGPAGKAGVKAGDTLLAFHGKRVDKADEVRRLASQIVTGQSIRLTVRRGDEEKEFTIIAGNGL